VQRTARFAKYLSRLGWRVHVWTTRGTPGLPVDESLLADVPPEVTVHRRDSFDVYSTLRSVRPGVGWRLAAPLRHILARSVPDERLWWALGSLRPLRRLVRSAGIDVIYSTFSPPSNHLLAWWMKRRTGVPWVADFRDLWTDDCTYRGRGIRRWMDRALETRFLRDADAVVAASESQRRILARRSSQRTARFHTITNGFDPDDFASPPPERERGTFVLTYVGALSSTRVDDTLIDGVADFARAVGDEQCAASPFRFDVVGVTSAALRERFQARGVPLSWSGYVEHAEAVRRMRAADVLLLPTAMGRNGDTLIPGKLFEYLASGRPILAVGDPEGEACRLVRRLGGGVTCERSAGAIRAALSELYRRRAGEGAASPSVRAGAARDLTEFSRAKLAEQLSDVLRGVCRMETCGHQMLRWRRADGQPATLRLA